MAEFDSPISLAGLLILGIGALVLAGGLFALIYWLMGRGRDDESS
jgi:hypothetical protein